MCLFFYGLGLKFRYNRVWLAHGCIFKGVDLTEWLIRCVAGAAVCFSYYLEILFIFEAGISLKDKVYFKVNSDKYLCFFLLVERGEMRCIFE